MASDAGGGGGGAKLVAAVALSAAASSLLTYAIFQRQQRRAAPAHQEACRVGCDGTAHVPALGGGDAIKRDAFDPSPRTGWARGPPDLN